jgi:hypothetical protein
MPVPDFSPGEVLTAAAMDSIGLWKISSTTFNNTASATIDNVFSATYTNYKLVVQLYGSSNSNILKLTFLNSSGTERVTNYYGAAWGVDYATGPTTLNSTGAQTTYIPLGYPSATSNKQPLVADVLIGNPWASDTRTSSAGPQTGINEGVVFSGGMTNGTYLTGERHRGFRISNTANTGLYGTVVLYGYRD